MFNNQLTTNSPSNLPVKNRFLNRLRFDRVMAMSLWPHFLGPPCTFLQHSVVTEPQPNRFTPVSSSCHLTCSHD